jgi:hypothetical protein
LKGYYVDDTVEMAIFDKEFLIHEMAARNTSPRFDGDRTEAVFHADGYFGRPAIFDDAYKLRRLYRREQSEITRLPKRHGQRKS